jgi:hypothetical protein
MSKYIEEELEKAEDNYEIAFHDKSTDRFIEVYYFYADDETEADKIYKKKYEKQYPLSEYNYEISYIGEFPSSDRGYEMSVDSSLYGS